MAIIGLKELLKDFENIEKKILEKRKDSMERATTWVEKDAVKLCPVGVYRGKQKGRVGVYRGKQKGRVGGRLRGSIARKVQIKDNKVVGRVGTNLVWKKSSGEKAKGYGDLVEFGTSKMKARPYLRPAFEKNKEKINKEFKTMINVAIDSELKKQKL
ncbi:MAG: HK97-gp10 family putative phage morphogenesis protein [Candidatus Thorarchaeota archaeon]